MNYSIIQYLQESGVGILTISRHDSLNALNSLFFKEFDHFLREVPSMKDLRVLIITGDGKSFVAGADIFEMQKMKVREGYNFSQTGQEAFMRLSNLDIPVIAAVNGYALGGGCELAMACDFRIANSDAKFGLPEANVGLIPGYGGTQRLSRLSGLGNALFMILTGQIIDAAEALRIGLVQKVVEPNYLMSETKSIANKITEQGPNAIKIAKKIIRKGYYVELDKGLDLESEAFSKMFDSDGQEGMKAFVEKRKPDWNSKSK